MADSPNASWLEASKLLTALRLWRGDDPVEIANRLDAHSKTKEGQKATQLQQLLKDAGGARGLLDLLERDKTVRPDLERETLRALCRCFHAPTLLLDSILSKTLSSDSQYLIESLDDFSDVTLEQPEYGLGATYKIPGYKLSNWEDVCVGNLLIAPNGNSDFHDHPGCELLFVLRGEAELRLENSGVHIPFGEHEFIQFRSDISHSVINPTDSDVELLVIRFFQLASNSSRRLSLQIVEETISLLDDLKEKLKSIKKVLKAKGKNADEKISSIADVLRPNRGDTGRQTHLDLKASVRSATTRVPSHTLTRIRKNVPEEVLDLFGLAVFLNRLKGKKSLKAIGEEGKFSSTSLFKIHHGQRAVLRGELSDLASQYGVETMVLYPFLYPAEPNIIACRTSEFAEVPEEITGKGIKYQIPRSNLAQGDANIFLITVGCGESTKLNSHPGCEFLMPLGKSKLTLTLGETKEVIDGARRQYAHFISDGEHSISNSESVPGKALVVRFHGERRGDETLR